MPALGALFPKSSQSGDRIQYYRLWPETLGLKAHQLHEARTTGIIVIT
jgi:hypothetical protein